MGSRMLRLGVGNGIRGLLIASATPLSASLASADDGPRDGVPGNYTGADISPGTVPDSPQAREKVALTLELDKVREGLVSEPEYLARDKAYRKKYGLAARPKGLRLMAPTSRTLKFTHFGQNNGYFCGPATGIMMIKWSHNSMKSKYNGNALSQANMANSAHMNTASVGRTDWSSQRFVTGINRWRGEKYHVQVGNPGGKLLQGALRHTVGTNGLGVAADTVEFAGGLHYNGHPRNRTIGHWIAAYGYSGSGATAKWADPSTTVWSGVSKTFSYNSNSFAPFLKSNGIAY